ncbi:MAG: hypothetical protein IPF92_19145 [Myxococcales bacterium]|nr:hypothetical protein [Myxococcales bacterium]MBL0194295.1 hypothetical protein [Myxococcales bacterium]HQY63632.1 hypothetical protein [Polyangiaceae bacterium]
MRFARLALLGALAPFLIRCGGDDPGASGDGGAQGADAPTATATATATATGTGTAPGDDGGSGLPTTTPGCGVAAKPSPAAGDKKTVDVGAAKRSYVLYVPAGYDPSRAYPVVFVFHGIGANGTQMSQFVKMQDYSAGNAIVVFPDGAGGRWDIEGEQDLLFFDAMQKSLGATLCVNPQRVFALGFSYGAYMTNHLGCRRSSAVRAIVAADGGFADKESGCGKTSALVYHRREDDDEPVANGVAARDKWIAINGCSKASKPVTQWGLDAKGCVAYDGCPGAAPVLWCEDTATSPYKHDLRDVYRVPMWKWMEHF